MDTSRRPFGGRRSRIFLDDLETHLTPQAGSVASTGKMTVTSTPKGYASSLKAGGQDSFRYVVLSMQPAGRRIANAA